MKYIIHTQDFFDKKIGEILSDEISRFDIRTDIFVSSAKKEIVQRLKTEPSDLLIEIGSKIEKLFERPSKKSGAKRCLIFQSIKVNNCPSGLKKMNLVIGDRPEKNSSTHYFGNPILEVIKSLATHSDSNDSGDQQVALVIEQKTSKTVLNALSKLSSEKIQFVFADLELNLRGAIQSIQNSNAAIVTGNIGELVTLQLNCPLVRVNNTGVFKRRRDSLVNELLNKQIVHVHSRHHFSLIVDSIAQIINDHNHCAGILQDYQQVKNLLGTEPAIRNMARYIVDWLDED